MPELDFAGWIKEWAGEIEQIQAHTKSDLPADPHLIQEDINLTTRYFPLAGELRAEVERLLINMRAVETLHIKGDPKFQDLTAPERKTVVESRVASVAKTRDILAVTCRALEERSFALMNQRRFAEAEMRMTQR